MLRFKPKKLTMKPIIEKTAILIKEEKTVNDEIDDSEKLKALLSAMPQFSTQFLQTVVDSDGTELQQNQF